MIPAIWRLRHEDWELEASPCFSVWNKKETKKQNKLCDIIENIKISFIFHNEITFLLLFIYSHVHTLFGSFFHPAFPHPFPPAPRQFQAGPVLPLSLILLKKRHMIKIDKAFLLVELRIAIQKDSYYCFHVSMCYDPCWFNSNWSLPWFMIPCSW
jgi:hypothetical protein